MWMMGYNEEMNLQTDSFNGRKLRPLVPRPANASFSSPSGTSPKLDNFSFSPHLGIIDQTKRELNTQQVVVTSRWNPTPEQLQTLEELYQRGTRTPSADQIQQITSQLCRYGKIEGKNVFYWFQNHKARERQKRRRQNESEPDPGQQQLCGDYDNAPCKESGVEANNKTGVEIEPTKSCCWRYTSSSNITFVPNLHQHQKTATLALKAGADDPECGRGNADGWLPFDKKELHQKPFLQRNSTWQILNRRFTNATTATTTTTLSTTVTSDTVDTVNPSFVKSSRDQTTLQLFPLRSDNDDGDGEREAENDTCRFNDSYQFFEFLPLKDI